MRIPRVEVARRVVDAEEELDAEDINHDDNEADEQHDVLELRQREVHGHHDGAQLLGRLDDAKQADDAEEAQHAYYRRVEGHRSGRGGDDRNDELKGGHDDKHEVEDVAKVRKVLLQAEADPLEEHLDNVDAEEDGAEHVHRVFEVDHPREVGIALDRTDGAVGPTVAVLAQL